MQLVERLSFESLYETIEFLLGEHTARYFPLGDGEVFSIIKEGPLVSLAHTKEQSGFPVFDPLIMVDMNAGQAFPLSCVSERLGQQDIRPQEGDWQAQEELLMFIGLWLKTLSDQGALTLEPTAH